LQASNTGVVKFVRETQKKYQVSWQNTVLVGFSQGAMLASLHGFEYQASMCQSNWVFRGRLYGWG